ncbi:protein DETOXIFICATION 14 [Sesamum angolense]|uniref:Protein DETOXIFICATION n=1 Tax=Sesamum angolense TaxID=2727404 RepID=A0AAE2BW38_9LAMI|nr:protein DETOXIFICATION 14 [Sesamum angolense]
MKEEDLLLKENEERVIWEEMKRVGYVAAPMVAVTLSEYMLQVISVMVVGHLGQLSLSATAFAISLSQVTGWSLLVGLAGGLETLNGQAYGAQQYEKLGTQTYTAIFSLNIVCIPLSILWIYMGNLLRLVGQDPGISHEAGKFLMWLLPSLFGYATLQPLIRYYQMQSLILPMLVSSSISICFHIIACWLLVFKSGLDSLGAAVSMGLSMWLNVIILILYMKYSSTCKKTRAAISMKIFQGMREFFRFAVPSTVMICLEWWSFELLILLAGLLPNPKLETSVLSVYVLIIIVYSSIMSNADFATSSIRISNELGAGQPHGARVSVIATMLLTATNAIIISTSLFASRKVFGHIFSNDKEVVDCFSNMAPFVCLSLIIDSIQGSLSGVVRGCGQQHVGAYVNIAAFYLFGIPIAVTLSFWLDFRGKGLWIGILSGAALQAVMLSVITSCTNWKKEAAKARRRLLEEEPSLEGGLTWRNDEATS